MKKEEILKVRVSKSEKKKLKEKAELANVSMSQLIRLFIIDEKILVYDYNAIQEMKNLVNEINRIGNNINQIVHNTNMNKYSEYEKKKLFAMQQAISDKVTVLIDQFYN